MAGGAEIIDVDRLQHEDIRSRRLAAAGEAEPQLRRRQPKAESIGDFRPVPAAVAGGRDR
jgi:hypothetical protein